MKARRIAIALIVVILLPGCLVTSLRPLFADGDLLFEDALLGSWRAGKERVTFERKDHTSSYWMTYAEDPGGGAPSAGAKDPGRFQARLGRIGGSLFLEVSPAPEPRLPDGMAFHLLPVYTFWRVRLNGDQLSVSQLSFDWFQGAIRLGGPPIRHEWIERDYILLTAPTPEVQAFLLTHAGDPKLFQQFGSAPFQREK